MGDGLLRLFCFGGIGVNRPPILPRQRRATHQDTGRPLAVQLNLVDGGVEAVVVGAQRVEHRPHHLVAFVVVERFVRLHIGGHHHRDDDVSVLFAGRLAHNAPY